MFRHNNLSIVRQFLSENKYSEALSLIDEIKGLSDEAIFIKGLCLYRLGFVREAYDYLKECLTNSSLLNKEIQVLIGMICANHKLDYEDAYEFFINAISDNTHETEIALNNLGIICCAEGLHDKAIDIIRMIKNPEHLALFALGLSYLMTKRFSEANDTFKNLFNDLSTHCATEFVLENLKTPDDATRFYNFLQGRYKKTEDDITIKIARYLRQYLSDTDNIRNFLRTNWQIGSFLNDLDGLIIYSLIRSIRPRNVIEFSPYKGCSTLYIYKALLDNNDSDFNFATFDIKEDKDFTEAMKAFGYSVKINEGDAIQTVPEYIKSKGIEGKVDLCLIDSEHTYDFANDYIREILPLLGENCILLFHDMLYRPEDIKEPFSHYEPINSDNICGYFVSLGEARALRQFFGKSDNYTLWSSHRLFGGLVNSGPPLPLNRDLLINIGLDLFNLQRGFMWNQPPMLLIAQPKSKYQGFVLID